MTTRDPSRIEPYYSDCECSLCTHSRTTETEASTDLLNTAMHIAAKQFGSLEYTEQVLAEMQASETLEDKCSG